MGAAVGWKAKAPSEGGLGLPVRAAQYVRMSTDHQRYSTENQQTAIAKYASQHGMEIVRTYADEGKSGLSLGEASGAGCVGHKIPRSYI